MKNILTVLAFCAVPAFAAPSVTPLAHTDQTVIGQPIVAPEYPTVIATIVTFQPGDKTAIHKHPWPHYAYVLEGVLTVTNTDTGKSFDIKPGDFLVEMQNTPHYGENKGSVAVKLLIVDTVPAGAEGNTVTVQP